MEIITDCEQLSDRWFSLRIGSVGGSSAKDLMAKGQGKSRGKLKYTLAKEIMTGVKSKGYTSKAMEDGIQREPESRKDFCFFTGLDVREVALIKGNVQRTHCSPDGLTSDGAGLELKNPIFTTQLKRLDEKMVPPEYEKQLQYSMWITGYSHWWFYSYHPKLHPFLIKAERDEKLIKEIETETIKFLAELNMLLGRLK